MVGDTFGMHHIQAMTQLGFDQKLKVSRPRLAVLPTAVQAARHFGDPIGRRGKLRSRRRVRGEVYNLSNTPHFSNPDGNVNDATFGIISSTLGGFGNRQTQVALRLLF
jgi:hypothetical protein